MHTVMKLHERGKNVKTGCTGESSVVSVLPRLVQCCSCSLIYLAALCHSAVQSTMRYVNNMCQGQYIAHCIPHPPISPTVVTFRLVRVTHLCLTA